MSCHGYDGVMSVLCTPLLVKCYRDSFGKQSKSTQFFIYANCPEYIFIASHANIKNVIRKQTEGNSASLSLSHTDLWMFCDVLRLVYDVKYTHCVFDRMIKRRIMWFMRRSPREEDQPSRTRPALSQEPLSFLSAL